MTLSPIRAFSFGGGVQSNAALALCAQVAQGRHEGWTTERIAQTIRALIGRPVALADEQIVALLDYPIFLFSNVGIDSEHPKTIAYVEAHSRPHAEAHHIELVELRKGYVRGKRAGTSETLLERIVRDDRTIGIPMRMDRTAAPGRRQCTRDFKVEVVDRELRRLGANQPVAWETRDVVTKTGRVQRRRVPSQYSPRAVMGLGISLDEITRMSSDDPGLASTKAYPLIELRLDRQDCLQIVARAGLPEPPKSSCWFCPFHSVQRWREMREEEPELFTRAVALERLLNERGKNLSTGPVWMTRYRIPLDQVVGSAQQADMWTDELEVCESGHCMV